MSRRGTRLLPNLPPAWRATPVRYATTCLDGRRVPLNGDERGRRQGEFPYWGANGVVDAIDDFIFDEPLVLLGEDGAPFFDKSKSVAFFVTGRIWVNNHIHVLRTEPDFEPRFVAYALNATDYTPWIEGSTRDKLTQDKMGSILLPTPSLAEQQSIANFLDRESTRIDGLVAAKQRLLDLLAEKRKAIVATAVTRGLDSKVKLRDSGVPWLGEIPAHWDVTRLKFCLNGIAQGWSPQCEAQPAGPDDWGVLKAGCVNGDNFNAEENKRLPDSETPLPEIEVRPRDVVMSRANTTELVGSAAIAPTDVRRRLMLSDKLYRLNVKADELLPEFLVHFLGTPSGRFDFERAASGASNSMQNISQDVVRSLWLPVPPLDEQHAIVAHITRETAKLDAVRAATERTIALLKERRSALIAAAATGQLDLTTGEGAAA